MDAPEEHSQRLIRGLRAGEAQVVREFCDQYGAALHRLAEKHLPRRLRRRLGPEDVVQSVCRTFLRRARLGEFQLSGSGELWRLLCAMTLNRVRKQTIFHLRHKRTLNREVPAAWEAEDGGTAGPQLAAAGPSPDEIAAFAEQFRQIIAALDDEERQVVDLKLQDYSTDEVAERLGCSARTVRRILKRLQTRFARTFEEA